jgi:hypothetical protein
MLTGSDAIAPDGQTGTDFFKLLCALVNVNVQSDRTQTNGSCQPANPSSNDNYLVVGALPSAHGH